MTLPTYFFRSILFAMVLLVWGCDPKTAKRGNMPLESQMAQVKLGESSKNDIARLFGSPSTMGTFDDNVWYYMSRHTEQYAFLDPKVVKHQVLVLTFDENAVLTTMKAYDENSLTRIRMEADKTPTAGNKLGVLEQILGNLGRFK